MTFVRGCLTRGLSGKKKAAEYSGLEFREETPKKGEAAIACCTATVPEPGGTATSKAGPGVGQKLLEVPVADRPQSAGPIAGAQAARLFRPLPIQWRAGPGQPPHLSGSGARFLP